MALFSYGSGCGAEFFAGRVVPGAGGFAAMLALGAPLAEGARVPLSVEDYEAMRRSEYLPDRPAPADRTPANGAASFLGVDSGERRVYGGSSAH